MTTSVSNKAPEVAEDAGEGVYHHSYSALFTFSMICQLQYFFRYVERLHQDRVGLPLVFGIAYQTALRVVDEALAKGQTPKPKRAIEALRSSLEKSWSNPDVPVVATGKPPTLEDTYQKAKAMIEHYTTVIRYDLMPLVDMPTSFMVPLIDERGRALERPLRGVIDRWVKDEDGRIGIIDWKTSATRWGERKLATDDQSTAYFLGGETILERKPDFFEFEVHLKTKASAIEIYPVERVDRDRKRFVKKFAALDKSLRSGGFVPNEQSWACPTCPFQRQCAKWQD